MKKMMKKAKFGIFAAILAGSLAACSGKGDGDADADAANRASKSNEQVKKDKEEIFEFRKEDGKAVLVKYNGSDEEVEIPEEYDGIAVMEIENAAFADNKTVKKVTIPASVIVIGHAVFETMEQNITIVGYSGTYAEYYAFNIGSVFESLGEWTAQASSVTVWDKDGKYCETLSLGKAAKADWLKGVSFSDKDGKSVLQLDNCDIGMIEQQWTGDLTIELAQGSKNYVTGGNGKDGISVCGDLTITGEGDISISGSDYHSSFEGDRYSIGYGVYVVGDLTIEGHVQMFAKAGKSKGKVGEGISVSGALTVSDSKVEAQAGESEMASPAIRVDSYVKEGKIVLKDVKVSEGGAVTPVHFVGTTEDTGEDYDVQSGESFSSTGSIVFDQDTGMGFEGASSYVRIEPEMAVNK